MGLAEKRKIEELKGKIAQTEKAVQEATGSAIPIEVKWDSIVKEDVMGYVDDAFQKVFIESTVKGFKLICADQMGKDAVKEAVKKIVMENTDKVIYGDRWCKFADGVVTLDHRLANTDNIDERAKGLSDALSKAL